MIDTFVTVRLVVYVLVVVFCVFIALWFESVPGNGSRAKVRLLMLPTLVTWLAISLSTLLKICDKNDYTGYLFFLAALYSVISLAAFTWRKK